MVNLTHKCCTVGFCPLITLWDYVQLDYVQLDYVQLDYVQLDYVRTRISSLLKPKQNSPVSIYRIHAKLVRMEKWRQSKTLSSLLCSCTQTQLYTNTAVHKHSCTQTQHSSASAVTRVGIPVIIISCLLAK